MDSTLAKNALKDYISRARTYMFTVLDEELEKSKEFGKYQVQMVQSYKNMIAEGKGMRGFLVETIYKACGGTDLENILPASTYIEFFHSAILIQDDFMDEMTLEGEHLLLTKNLKVSRKN